MKKTFFICCLFLLNAISWGQCEDFEVEVLTMDPTCHMFSDGSVTLDISGATAPVVVEITDVDGFIVNTEGMGWVNTLSAGCYYIYVEDSLGCIFEDSTCLEDPGPLTVELTITDPSSDEACDGMIEIDTVYNYCGDYNMISCFFSPDPDPDGDCILTDLCTGEYTLTLNDECGCSAVFDISVGNVSIDEELLNAITVFYDYQTKSIRLVGDLNEIAAIQLYDLSGKMVMNKVLTAGSVINTNLKNGIYIYQILGASGEPLQSGKLSF